MSDYMTPDNPWQAGFALLGQGVAFVLVVLVLAGILAGAIYGWRSWWRLQEHEGRISDAEERLTDALRRVAERTRTTR